MDTPLDRVRALCMAIPNASERLSHGEAAWFVEKGRQFAAFADRHHDDRVAVWLAAPPGVQESLIQEAPRQYFRPPYVGPRGWVGVYLDVEDVDWAALDDLLRDAFRHVAPAKFATLVD